MIHWAIYFINYYLFAIFPVPFESFGTFFSPIYNQQK